MVIPRDYDRPSGNLQCQPAHNDNRLSGNLRHTSHPHLQGHANINNKSSTIIRNPTTRVVENVASCQPAPPHSYSPHHEGMRDQSRSSHPYSGRNSDSNKVMTPMYATNNKTTTSSSISSNHCNKYYSSNSNNNHIQNSNNYNTTSTNNNNNKTASTISSPTSHPTATTYNNNVMASSYHYPTTSIRSTKIPSYPSPSHPYHQLQEQRGHSSSSSYKENDIISSHPLSSHVQHQRDDGRKPSHGDGANTFWGESIPLIDPVPLMGPGGNNQWWYCAQDIFFSIVSSTILHTHCLLLRQQFLRTCSPCLQI